MLTHRCADVNSELDGHPLAQSKNEKSEMTFIVPIQARTTKWTQMFHISIRWRVRLTGAIVFLLTFSRSLFSLQLVL